ncbi:MAG: DUF4367 domain-containing protein [Firmicutes bacterium]|nr:DUF4367 domain-containing protein [Bacillota bacterium]
MNRMKNDKNNDCERGFAFLLQKSPAELLDEMEDKIMDMSEDGFDADLVEAYISALDAKAPLPDSFDPELSYQRFSRRYAEQLEPFSLKQTHPAWRNRFHWQKCRMACTAAIICLFLLAGTAIVEARGVHVFAMFVEWGAEALQLSRDEKNASGSLLLPADSDQEYHSLEEALEAHGLSAEVCPTWIPARFHLALVDVQIVDGRGSFVALYEDDAEGILNFSIMQDLGSSAWQFNVEIDEGSGETYVLGGTEYFLATNMGEPVASWLDESCFYILAGSVTMDELKQILASM